MAVRKKGAILFVSVSLGRPDLVFSDVRLLGNSLAMDIFNRPPAISEDTLQYALYPPQSLSDKPSVTTFAACMHTYVDSLLPDFIWHRDAFELKVVPNPDFEGQWMLEGRMRVGDSVDDEWCTVWLLKEISNKWDVVIRYVVILGCECVR